MTEGCPKVGPLTQDKMVTNSEKRVFSSQIAMA